MKLPLFLLSVLTMACAQPPRPTTTPAAGLQNLPAAGPAPNAGSTNHQTEPLTQTRESDRPPVNGLSPPSACDPASGHGALPSLQETSSADLVARHGSGLDAYAREGGRWLPHLPVLVNEDFDFATAMGLSAIGAGIAARSRMDHNQEKADALSELNPTPRLEQRLNALRRCGLHAYFLLWGTDQPVLKLVVDDLAEAGSSETELPHHVVLGAGRTLHGADGWSESDALADEMLRLLEQDRHARLSAAAPDASAQSAE